MHFLIVLLWLGIIASQQVIAENSIIEVITSDAYPVTGIAALQKKGITVKLYNFDDGPRMVKQLEANLPRGEKAATKAMALRLKKIGDAALARMFSDAFQAISIGTERGLTQYPAVIFENGRSVVYGVTDLPRAMTLYQQWVKKNDQ